MLNYTHASKLHAWQPYTFFYAKSNHIGVYVVLIIAWIEVRSMEVDRGIVVGTNDRAWAVAIISAILFDLLALEQNQAGVTYVPASLSIKSNVRIN